MAGMRCIRYKIGLKQLNLQAFNVVFIEMLNDAKV